MTDSHAYSSVVLGFAEEATTETTQPANFASKAGGLPVWLYRSATSAAPPPKCAICNQRQRFLAQVYAPVDEEEAGHSDTFHRVLYVSLCENVSCVRSNKPGAVSVLRAQLPRRNDFYDYHGGGVVPKGGLDVCDLCGFKAEKKCGQCARVSYCSRTCQSADWKCGHKTSCGNGEEVQGRDEWRFREMEIVTESHPTPSSSDNEDSDSDGENCDATVDLTTEVDEERKGRRNAIANARVEKPEVVGTFQDADEDELPEDLFRGRKKKDRLFERFQKTVSMAKSQVIRYEREGTPLLVTKDEQCTNVDACELCGAERVFEMQIMPQLTWYVCGGDMKREMSIQEVASRLRDDMDWGTIVVFCCRNSCEIDGRFAQEVAIVQQMSTQLD